MSRYIRYLESEISSFKKGNYSEKVKFVRLRGGRHSSWQKENTRCNGMS